MNISYLIQILQNKITILTNAKSQAFSIGDLDQVNSIDKELLSTQNTFSQLTMLADINQAASVANTTPAELIVSGLQAVQNQTQGPSASAIINGYNVSAYATDTLYEQKIRNILSLMPVFTIVMDIDNYIQEKAVGSPVTGDMVYRSAKQYSVDLPLMLAIMQNDSSFGTKGVGARTFNPGNIGNNGSDTKSFATWLDGVTAVAEWLNRHRQIDQVLIPIAEVPVSVSETPLPEVFVAPITSTTTPKIIIENITKPEVPASEIFTLPVTTPSPESTIFTQNSESGTSTPEISPATTTPDIPVAEISTETGTTTEGVVAESALDTNASSTPQTLIEQTEPTQADPATNSENTIPVEIGTTSPQARVIKIKRNRV